MKPVACLISIAACLAAVPAIANDTMMELRTGGLAYVQTDEISMVEEDLYISPEEIRVDYVFRNNGDEDVTAYIAFPMPDIRGEPESMMPVSDPESDNFLGFTVLQDGRAITPQLQQRVTALGLDVGAELEARGVSFLPFSERTQEALEKLPPDVLAEWKARGIVYDNVFDDGEGMRSHPTPLWTLQSVYWWQTTFPAGREVKVHHSYRPSVGGTAGITFVGGSKQDEWYDNNLREYREKFCVDAEFETLAARLARSGTDGNSPYYTENWISYILTTGANWGGSIEKFRLTVDKGSPRNFVSFCGTGVKKTGPTTFEMEATDFYPERDLNILLLVASE